MRCGNKQWRDSVARYDLLIFDWDGTLVDSIGRIVQAIASAAQDCGLEPPLPEATRGIIGLAMPQAIAVLYPELEDPLRVRHFQQTYSDHYLALEANPSALYSGVGQGLQLFRDQGYALAVATGKTRRGLDRVLAGQGWHGFFDITRCADETASKPDPLMLHEILAHCRACPERALMVGDSVFDLDMAKAAGIDAVGVSYGAQPAEVLRAREPVLMIERFEQLAEWLANPAL